MPLDTTNFHPQGPVKSVDMLQFYNLFTGVMTDQPVTFSNTLTLGGNQNVTTVPLRVYGAIGQNTNLIDMYLDKNQAQPGFGFNGSGRLGWGPGGTAPQDTFMSRIALQNGHSSDTPGLYITPVLELPLNTLNGGSLVDHTVTNIKLATDVGGQALHEEFLPTAAATVVTISQNPTAILYVSRNGVVQSVTDNHYSAVGPAITFTTPFDGTERVDVGYTVGPVGGSGLTDGQVTTPKLADQAVTNVKLASDVYRPNLLQNGGFEVWTMPGGSSVTGTTPVDGWLHALGGSSTFAATRIASTISGGYAEQVAYTHAASGNLYVTQAVLGFGSLQGKQITVSFRVKSSVVGAIKAGIFDGSWNFGSYNATTAGETISFTRTLGAVTTLSVGVVLDIATATVELAEATLVIGSVGTGFFPAQLPDAIPNARLASDTARANLLTNGGFEIWQRGNGPNSGSGVFVAGDRWVSSLAGSDAISVSKDTTNVDTGSQACAACAFTLGTGGGASTIYQKIPSTDGYQLAGRQMSLSVRVRTATPNAVRIGLFDGSAWTQSTFHTGSGAYQTLTVTATMSGPGTNWQCGIFFAASCTAYLDNACLVVGSQAADYVPLHPADDLARCQRYYEEIQTVAGNTIFIGAGYASATGGISYPFKTKKAVAPTITTSANQWILQRLDTGAQSSQGPGINGTTVDSFALYSTGSHGNGIVSAFFASGSVGSFKAEANP